MENFLSFNPVQHSVISHTLMFGVGAHLAGLLYFILSRDRVSPRSRMATILSCIVMATAGAMLLRLAVNWQMALTFDGTLWRRDVATSSNGFL